MKFVLNDYDLPEEVCPECGHVLQEDADEELYCDNCGWY